MNLRKHYTFVLAYEHGYNKNHKDLNPSCHAMHNHAKLEHSGDDCNTYVVLLYSHVRSTSLFMQRIEKYYVVRTTCSCLLNFHVGITLSVLGCLLTFLLW